MARPIFGNSLLVPIDIGVLIGIVQSSFCVVAPKYWLDCMSIIFWLIKKSLCFSPTHKQGCPHIKGFAEQHSGDLTVQVNHGNSYSGVRVLFGFWKQRKLSPAKSLVQKIPYSFLPLPVPSSGVSTEKLPWKTIILRKLFFFLSSTQKTWAEYRRVRKGSSGMTRAKRLWGALRNPYSPRSPWMESSQASQTEPNTRFFRRAFVWEGCSEHRKIYFSGLLFFKCGWEVFDQCLRISR